MSKESMKALGTIVLLEAIIILFWTSKGYWSVFWCINGLTISLLWMYYLASRNRKGGQ